MEELVNMIAQKSGLSSEMSKTVVDTVLGFVKNKLPAPIARQIDNVLGSGSTASVESALGGMFGKK